MRQWTKLRKKVERQLGKMTDPQWRAFVKQSVEEKADVIELLRRPQREDS